MTNSIKAIAAALKPGESVDLPLKINVHQSEELNDLGNTPSQQASLDRLCEEHDATLVETITVNRQALLDVVRVLDIGANYSLLPNALDHLREPFFEDEISSGTARTDGSMNSYNSGD